MSSDLRIRGWDAYLILEDEGYTLTSLAMPGVVARGATLDELWERWPAAVEAAMEEARATAARLEERIAFYRDRVEEDEPWSYSLPSLSDGS